jgi:hypothetical protein
MFLCGVGFTWLVDVDRLAYPPALSYDLQPLNEGTWPPVRCRLVPSCCSGWWRFSGGCEAPCLDIHWRVDRLGSSFTWSILFLARHVYHMSESL